MDNEMIAEFFDRFSIDFRQFDGRLIADRYFLPFMPVSASGVTQLLQDKNDVAVYFQSYLDQYRNQGVTACGYKDLQSFQIGECALIGIVTWLLTDADGGLRTSWRESYNLLRRADHLLVYSSADFG